jgi:hypothetical protein
VQTFEWCAHVQKMLVEYVLKSVKPAGWQAGLSRRIETAASQINEWLSSPGLQPPK